MLVMEEFSGLMNLNIVGFEGGQDPLRDSRLIRFFLKSLHLIEPELLRGTRFLLLVIE